MNKVNYYINPKNSGIMPAGYIVSSNSNLTGMIPCDGRLIHKNTFKELFNIIGTRYGGSGYYFRMPDLTNKLDLTYQSWWDNWPCASCKEIFLKHDYKSTWLCSMDVQSDQKMSRYKPMDKLDYMEWRANVR